MRSLHIHNFAGFLIIIFAILLLFVYNIRIQGIHSYLGYQQIKFDISYAISTLLMLSIVIFILPVSIRRPSDFITLFYGVFTLLPFAVLHPIRGIIDTELTFGYFLLLVFPPVFIRFIASRSLLINFPKIWGENFLYIILIAMMLSASIILLLKAPSSASFSFTSSDVYNRRLEARDIFLSRDLYSYVVSFITSINPFVVFLATISRRYWLFLFSIVTLAIEFYTLGTKLSIFYICLAWGIGLLYVNKSIKRINLYLYAFLLIILIIAIWDNYSFSDYFIRRALCVPPFVVAAYTEFIAGWQDPLSFLTGIHTPTGVTFAVGDEILGDPDKNVNTNAFLYHYAAGGIVGYLFVIFLVTMVYAILDGAYKREYNPMYLFTGCFYALLLTEKAATTALTSSGIAIIILLSIFSRYRTRRQTDKTSIFTNSASLSNKRLQE